MKYCPYCGADLPGSAASFCPECGKSMNNPAVENGPPAPTQKPPPKQNHSMQRSSQSAANKRPPPRTGPQTQMKRATKQKPPVRPKPNQKRRPPPARASAAPNPMDINYDGYYDDVPTADNGQTKERMEPELIKRIALIAAGAVVMVILSIIIMYVL